MSALTVLSSSDMCVVNLENFLQHLSSFCMPLLITSDTCKSQEKRADLFLKLEATDAAGRLLDKPVLH